MSKYIPFTPDELYRAHHSDIKSVLESFGEKVRPSGSQYEWIKHDSVKIRGFVWYRFSERTSGTAVTFLQEFFGYSFQEAVIYLLKGDYRASRNTTAMDYADLPDKKYKSEKIILPPKNDNNDRLFGYLCNYRGIQYSTVKYFVDKKLIYESADRHNIVCLGYDKRGNVKYLYQEGTLSFSTYKNEYKAPNKKYGFKYIGGSNILYVFESFIDMFSYIDLFLLEKDWKDYNYLSMGGLKYERLKHLLESYGHIKKVIICTDNDTSSSDGINHGQRFARQTQISLQSCYDVSIHTPMRKDFNEDLKVELGVVLPL